MTSDHVSHSAQTRSFLKCSDNSCDRNALMVFQFPDVKNSPLLRVFSHSWAKSIYLFVATLGIPILGITAYTAFVVKLNFWLYPKVFHIYPMFQADLIMARFETSIFYLGILIHIGWFWIGGLIFRGFSERTIHSHFLTGTVLILGSIYFFGSFFLNARGKIQENIRIKISEQVRSTRHLEAVKEEWDLRGQSSVAIERTFNFRRIQLKSPQRNWDRNEIKEAEIEVFDGDPPIDPDEYKAPPMVWCSCERYEFCWIPSLEEPFSEMDLKGTTQASLGDGYLLYTIRGRRFMRGCIDEAWNARLDDVDRFQSALGIVSVFESFQFMDHFFKRVIRVHCPSGLRVYVYETNKLEPDPDAMDETVERERLRNYPNLLIYVFTPAGQLYGALKVRCLSIDSNTALREILRGLERVKKKR